MASKGPVYLERRDNVYYLHLNSGKANNFNTEFVRQINAQLDIVEKDENLSCLVTISNLDKFYSTGLDLKYVSTREHPEDLKNFLLEFCQLLGRLLVFPVPTIAFLNGIAMAGGFMFAMAHDYRIMAEDKTWVCLNEVDMGLPLLPMMNAVVQCKLAPHAYREVFLRGKRVEAKEAKELHIADFVYNRKEIAEKVHQFANELAEKSAYKENFKALKMEAYMDAYLKGTDKKFGMHSNSVKALMSLGKL